MLLLDEPSSGIAQREAEALGPLLLRIRDQTGATLLVIEHDVPLLLGIADRLIALDLGEIVADRRTRRRRARPTRRALVPRVDRRGDRTQRTCYRDLDRAFRTHWGDTPWSRQTPRKRRSPLVRYAPFIVIAVVIVIVAIVAIAGGGDDNNKVTTGTGGNQPASDVPDAF